MSQRNGISASPNIRLAPDVHEAIRRAAYTEHTSMAAVVDQALRTSPGISRYLVTEEAAK